MTRGHFTRQGSRQPGALIEALVHHPPARSRPRGTDRELWPPVPGAGHFHFGHTVWPINGQKDYPAVSPCRSMAGELKLIPDAEVAPWQPELAATEGGAMNKG